MNRYARRVAKILAVACACAAVPVLADNHTETECREGGEFIRNAALSRDAGTTRGIFLDRLAGDLLTIRSLAPGLRWFARDEDDEKLLMDHAQRVFDRPAEPAQHEEAFLQACQPRI
jgi:hypothetical protein